MFTRRRRAKNTNAPNVSANAPSPRAPMAGTGGNPRTDVTSVTESFDDVVSGGLAAETLAEFEIDPVVLGAVTVIVNTTFAPFASDSAVQVTVVVPAHAPVTESAVNPLGSVSTTLIEVAVSGPLFVTVSV